MRIIAHRGAKGYADENSLAAIKIASEVKQIEFIELDIRFTSNNVIVLQHDSETPKGKPIAEYTYKTLQRDISYLTTLRQALKFVGDKSIILDSKANGTIAKSKDIIQNQANVLIASALEDEILASRINLPSHKTFLIKSTPIFGAIDAVKKVDASGLAVNAWWSLLLPYYYYKCQKNNLDFFVYTVNSYWYAKMLNIIMPKAWICTDYPKKFK